MRSAVGIPVSSGPGGCQKGNQNLDPAKRKAILTEASKLVMEDYPLMPLWQSTVPRLVKSYVGGYTATNFLDRYRGKDLYIIKH
jgi:oligopeptide transport system substrate-binding protein